MLSQVYHDYPEPVRVQVTVKDEEFLALHMLPGEPGRACVQHTPIRTITVP